MNSNSILADARRSGAPAVTDNAPRAPSLADRVFRKLARLVVGAHRRTAARRELAKFNDRELRDIGLSRSDIQWVVRERPRDSVVCFID
jgi:uncharacterized protein YjiS (DUF1127 family)